MLPLNWPRDNGTIFPLFCSSAAVCNVKCGDGTPWARGRAVTCNAASVGRNRRNDAITQKKITELIPKQFRFGNSSTQITEYNSQKIR